MKEEDKYYVPEISEFHIGFEYEIIIGNEFVVSYFGEGVLQESANDIRRELKYDRVRVKYLDKEDIESLGFILDKDEGGVLKKNGIITSYYNYSKVDINYQGGCIDIMDNGKYRIFYGNFNSFRSRIRFEGFIKNKSELKVLLKQLGI